MFYLLHFVRLKKIIYICSKFNVGMPSKLYQALEAGVNTSTNSVFSELYPGYTVTAIMDSWISQSGYPILTVNVDYETEKVTLNQVIFLLCYI